MAKMSDSTKTGMSCFFVTGMFVLSLVALTIGWIGWNIRVGSIAGLFTFAIFFMLSGGALVTVNNLSWFAVGMPLGAAVIYTILPDFIPLPIDDAIVLASGSMLTFTLWLRKQPETPRWIVFPLLLASLYTLVGVLIPGPVDELIVLALGTGVSIYGSRKNLLPSGR